MERHMNGSPVVWCRLMEMHPQVDRKEVATRKKHTQQVVVVPSIHVALYAAAGNGVQGCNPSH